MARVPYVIGIFLLLVEISSAIENTKEYIKNVLRMHEESSKVREFSEIRPWPTKD